MGRGSEEKSKPISRQRKNLAEQVRDHAEYRQVPCVWGISPDGGFVELVRQDTGEVIASRALTPDERQGRLFVAPVARSAT